MKRFSILVLLLAVAAALPLSVGSAQDRSVVVYAHPVSFPDLDPSSSYSNENTVMVNAYETLTLYNPPGSEDVLGPKLATSWESSEDGMIWTFNLREGVKFHDGADFNAEAVKLSLERTMDLGLGASFIYDPIESIEVIDDLTIQFGLSYAAPLDLIFSSGYAAWMISPNALEQDNDWFNAGNGAGTGPYQITSYEPGQRLVMDRFDDYWGGWEDGQFDTVVFEIVEDVTVLEQMIRAGDADFTYSLPFDNYASLAEAPGVVVDTTPSFQNLLILLNNVKEPTNNVLVRQALSYSFPYQDVVDNLYAGLGTQARGPIPANMWGHSEDLFQYQQDMDKARELLAEAGYPDGGFTITYTHVAEDLDEQQVAELWRPSLAELGIELDIQGLAWEAQWDLAINDPSTAQEGFAFYWWPSYVTPYDFLFAMFHSEEEPFFNLGYYNNPEYDAVIDGANELTGTDLETATAQFIEAQQMLIDDAAAIFVVDLPDIHVIRDDITGYVNNPGYPHTVFFYNLRR